MRRYLALAARPTSSDWLYPTQVPSITVHEPERAPKPTGLFDARGVPIFAIDDRAPLGFAIPTPKS